jgi:5'-nucleotidase
VKVITDAGYIDQGAKDGKYSYSFDGAVGSLDHVFASPAADRTVTGVDTWNINSGESVALEYSRYDYNATIFYDTSAYRSSDHDPVVVGLDLPETQTDPEPEPVTVIDVATTASTKRLAVVRTLTVSAVNNGPETVSIEITTAYGSKTKKSVKPGQSFTVKTVTVFTPIKAGTATIEVTAPDGTERVYKQAYRGA